MEINIAEGNPNSWHSFDAAATLGNATTTNITKVNTSQLRIAALCWQGHSAAGPSRGCGWGLGWCLHHGSGPALFPLLLLLPALLKVVFSS